MVPMSVSTATLAPGTWIVDPVHSDISFRVRHMGVGRVHGTFTLASAALTVAAAGAAAGSMRAVVDAASVLTATTTISRAAFGVDIQLGFGAGNVVVADTIEIMIDVEFIIGGAEQS
jgi:polyisoprenoid-binding protein YceI